MKHSHVRRILVALAVLGCGLLRTTNDASAGGGFVVMVHKSNEVTALSKGELKKVITGGTKQWKNGAAVQLGIIAEGAPETQHLAALVDMTPKELLARIQEQVFKGEMRRPVMVHSSAECVAFARANPGAICVCSAAMTVPPEAHPVTVR
jgi:ABC-type phosphate transport system substrate-binding protein